MALAALAYFGTEFAAAQHIGSVSLLADSIDFLADALVNTLIALSFGWNVRARAFATMVMAASMLLPALAFLWTAWQKFQAPVPPDPWVLSGVGLGALVVNQARAWLLARFRDVRGSLTRAAFLSARNDAAANVVIIAAGGMTLFRASGWPDPAVGIGIAILNANAARDVWRAAREEGRAPAP